MFSSSIFDWHLTIIVHCLTMDAPLVFMFHWYLPLKIEGVIFLCNNSGMLTIWVKKSLNSYCAYFSSCLPSTLKTKLYCHSRGFKSQEICIYCFVIPLDSCDYSLNSWNLHPWFYVQVQDNIENKDKGNFHSTSPVKGNIFCWKKERNKKKFEFSRKERKLLELYYYW